MVSLATVRAHNASLKSLGSGLVAVFVGGTSGIGLYTVREFARYTVSPTVYLVGRNEAQAKQVIQELSLINPHGKFQFIKTDASLLRGVDSACEVIQKKESRINLLFLSCGIFTMKGRDGRPWMVAEQECGERHLYVATSGPFPSGSLARGQSNIDVPENRRGAYLLSWDGAEVGNRKLLDEYHASGVGRKVWEHTEDMFQMALKKR
ncbi:hypothetical protein AFCA_007076 [Aspergillus flavus]|nr:hypothetical protein AFCA_007076 [Aspergillus flavus]